MDEPVTVGILLWFAIGCGIGAIVAQAVIGLAEVFRRGRRR